MSNHSLRDNVILAVELGSVIAIGVVAFRLVGGPDATRKARMRMAQAGEGFCMGQAKMWAELADSCTSAYNEARSVTV